MNIKDKKTFLIDLDGTIYNGNTLTKKADKFIEKLIELNLEYFFITNNAHQSPEDISLRLKNIGIECSADNIITCSQATIEYLEQNHSNSKISLLANDYLEKTFKEKGFNLVKENADIVVVGFDYDLTFSKLSDAVTNVLNGAKLVCTGVDGSIPANGGVILPYTGAIAMAISVATHTNPIYIGKPEKFIFNTILNRISNDISECLMIGDRLDTDIDFGLSNNIDTCLTLTGLTDEKLLNNSDIKPDFVCKDLGELMDLL